MRFCCFCPGPHRRFLPPHVRCVRPVFVRMCVYVRAVCVCLCVCVFVCVCAFMHVVAVFSRWRCHVSFHYVTGSPYSLQGDPQNLHLPLLKNTHTSTHSSSMPTKNKCTHTLTHTRIFPPTYTRFQPTPAGVTPFFQQLLSTTQATITTGMCTSIYTQTSTHSSLIPTKNKCTHTLTLTRAYSPTYACFQPTPAGITPFFQQLLSTTQATITTSCTARPALQRSQGRLRGN